jgi:hypothetical protein
VVWKVVAIAIWTLFVGGFGYGSTSGLDTDLLIAGWAIFGSIWLAITLYIWKFAW